MHWTTSTGVELRHLTPSCASLSPTPRHCRGLNEPITGASSRFPYPCSLPIHLLLVPIQPLDKMASIKPDHTVSYKRVGSLEIFMDIYLPNNAKKAPVLLWFHGGGLLCVQVGLLATALDIVDISQARTTGPGCPSYAQWGSNLRLCVHLSRLSSHATGQRRRSLRGRPRLHSIYS